MGTHPIFESDFDCLTESKKMSTTWDVQLYIYDLSQGFAAMMSEPLLGFKLEAIYHTAIIVYGKEYYYGGGISGTGINELDRPGTTQLGAPMRRVTLGATEIDQEMRLFLTHQQLKLNK